MAFLFKKSKKFDFKYLITLEVFIVLLIPHLIWLYNNDFVSILYGLKRTGLENSNILNHINQPLIFLIKQIGILIPLFFLTWLLVKKINFKFNLKDKNLIFLIAINLLPIFLMLLTSIITGSKIRTMWMTPFYLFIGVLLIQIFKEYLNHNGLKKFLVVFIIFFILSPTSYLVVSFSNKYKRTDYPGKEISNLVQKRWDKNFTNRISIVIGDEWYAGNLSYHLSSRPIWYNTIENNLSLITSDTGVIYTGNPKILKKFCPGIYGTIKPIGICMIGAK